MTLFQKSLGIGCLAVLLGAVAAWGGASAWLPEQRGALLAAVILISLLVLFCMGLAVRFFLVRPLLTAEILMRKMAAGTLDAVPAFSGAPMLQTFYGNIAQVLQILKFEKALNHGLFQGLPMPYLLVDTQERATRTNQACLDMLQIDDSIESCLGKTLAELFYKDPGRKTAVGKSIHNNEYFHNMEVTITGHKGRKVDVLANIFPVCDESNVCIGGLCLYVDMTALKEAEKVITDKNERMVAAANALETAVDNLSGIAEGLSQGIRQSDSGAAKSAERLSEAATAMNEMNATVQEVARNAEAASGASAHTREKAEAGAQIVEKAVRSIEQVHQVSLDLKGDMGQLASHAQAISQIMSVISDIADQTNLLALNAAIEAARAGDAGRGFAVVADEVRNLAEKTMASTQDVGNAIKAIQESASKSMLSVDNAVAQIEQATDFASQSGQALEEIVATVEHTAEQVSAIAAASEEQSAASEQINRSIEQVNGMAADTANSMAAAREEMVRLMELTRTLTSLTTGLKE